MCVYSSRFSKVFLNNYIYETCLTGDWWGASWTRVCVFFELGDEWVENDEALLTC